MTNHPVIVTGTPVEPIVLDEEGFQNITPATIIEQPGPVPMIEVDEISMEGWLCLIVGCVLCPGFNLFGLCMRKRRLVPASSVEYVY